MLKPDSWCRTLAHALTLECCMLSTTAQQRVAIVAHNNNMHAHNNTISGVESSFTRVKCNNSNEQLVLLMLMYYMFSKTCISKYLNVYPNVQTAPDSRCQNLERA